MAEVALDAAEVTDDVTLATVLSSDRRRPG